MRFTPRFVLNLLMVIVLATGALVFITTQEFTSWDFRNNLWGPAHLLVTGRSPYLIDQLFTGSNSIWLPTIIGALFPLGFLSQQAATNLWFLLSLVCLLVIFYLSMEVRRPPVLLTAVVLTAAFVFPPFISHAAIGQFSLWATLLMLLATRAVIGRQFILTVLLVVLALAKPQLIVLPALGLLLLCYREGRSRGVFFFIGAGVIWTLLLLLPLFIGYSDWLTGYSVALSRNYVWAHPSSLYVLRLAFGSTQGIILWAILALTVLTANIWIWRNLPPKRAMMWSLALNVLATPYAWSWDFVLLMPLLIRTAYSLRSQLARGVLMLGYCAVWLGMVQIRLGTEGDDVRFWWVPGTLIGLVTLAYLIQRQTNPKVLQDGHQPT